MEGCRRSKSPARCNGLPLDVGLVTKVTRSDASSPDTPIGRTCLRGTQTRRPRRREHTRRRGEQNGGDERRAANGQTIMPRARVPVGLVHHPAGTSRATGQADASSHGDATAGPAPGRTSDFGHDARRRLARETHAAGRNAERGAGRSHITYLDRLLLAPRPTPRVKPEDKHETDPEGVNPDRRRSLGFLTSRFSLHTDVPPARPRRAKPQVHQEGCFEARASRGHLSMRGEECATPISPLVGEKAISMN